MTTRSHRQTSDNVVGHPTPPIRKVMNNERRPR
jgi:hypothetical protein